MPLPTNRTAGSVIQSADINAIADAVNDVEEQLDALDSEKVGKLVALFNGSDETAALQAALNSSKSVIIPSGKTIRANGITVPDGVTLAGEDRSATIDLFDPAGDTSASVTMGNNTALTNLTLTQSDAATRKVLGLVVVNGKSNIRVSGVTFGASVAAALIALTATDLSITDCKIVGPCLADGFHITRGSTRVRITNNDVRSCGDDAISVFSVKEDAGIPAYGLCQDIVISGNTVGELTGALGGGVVIYGGENIVISDNAIRDVSSVGIGVGYQAGGPGVGSHLARKVVVSNNTITRPGFKTTLAGNKLGIGVSNARQVSVLGNTVDQAPTAGIHLGGVCKEAVLGDNLLLRNGFRGIDVSQDALIGDAVVLAGLFTELGETAPASAGISHVHIKNNVVRQTTDIGVRVSIVGGGSQPGYVVEGNTVDVTSTGTKAFEIASVRNSVISGNRVASGTRGVDINAVTNTVVDGNSLTEVSDVGVAMTACSDVVVSNNLTAVFEPAGSGNSTNLFSGNNTRGRTFIVGGTGSVSSGNLS